MSSLLNIAAGNPAAGGFYDYQIDNSLRFDRPSNADLTRTPSSAGNRQTFTMSVWAKPSSLATTASDSISFLGINDGDTSDRANFYIGLENLIGFLKVSGTNYFLTTSIKYRDVSAWYNFVWAVDTTQATASNRAKLYVNGEQITAFTTSNYPPQNSTTVVNGQFAHNVGSNDLGGDHMDGYLADVNFIDGQQLDPTSFGETKSGVWIPKDTSGLTFGTNGFRLEFGDSAAIGDDTSGNGNDYTANNLSAHDVVPDSPTNNYAVVNPLARSAQDPRVTLSEGNLNISAVTNSDSPFNTRFATIPLPSSGKYYAECRAYEVSSNGNQTVFGVVDPAAFDANEPEAKTLYNFTDGEGFDGFNMLLNPNIAQAYSGGATSGSQITGLTATSYILKLALDIDNGKVFVGYDGVWLNSADPAAGTGEIATRTFTTSDVIAIQTTGNSSGNNNGSWLNFGQDSTFGGNVTAGGNSDANGYGDFAYAVPSGYLALNTANLPEPAISPLEDEVPEDYFNTVLYSGNDSTQSVTGVNFLPDLLWLKSRTNTNSHLWVDSVRGSGSNGLLYLISNSTGEEVDGTNITSLDSDGFTLDSSAGTNGSGRTFVAWNWKAGTSFSNSAGANGADIASSGSVSTKSGFSIVEYTGSNSANDVVYHGIGTAPSLIIIKNRDVGTSSGAWGIFTDRVEAERLQFDNNADFNNYPIQSFDANTFQLPTLNNTAWSVANDYIAYCFASIEGYSKIGIYTGNGSADGTFVYTGFRPAWIMVKRSSATSSASGWFIADNARNISNVVDNKLTASSSQEENDAATIGASGSNDFDFLSNGFKPRATNSGTNNTDDTYLYMAFAEMPQKYANAR